MKRFEWQPPPTLWHKLKPLARQMRRQPTVAENRLWHRLCAHQIRGAKFRRQFAIERFITDFCAPGLRLIIEVDGPTHEYSKEEDAIRQELLESAGFEVLRFTNLEVLNQLEAVLDRIDAAVQRKMNVLGDEDGHLAE